MALFDHLEDLAGRTKRLEEAVMIGGALMGALGALIAIPVAETLRFLFEGLRGHQVEAAASPPTVLTRG